MLTASNEDQLSTASVVVSDLCFEDLGLRQEMLLAIREQGYTKPTLIQAKAIPLILQGVDLLAAAQTGTGKTASFALPIIHRLAGLASKSTSPARHPIRALILTPTRELADQVNQNIANYAKYTDLRSAAIYGGVDIRSQAKILQNGVEILTATPGRLLDHLDQKHAYLNQVQILVLDEADRMLDMGFMLDLQKILALLPNNRQSLLFSATFSSEVRTLAQRYMNDYQLLEVTKPNAAAALVEQVFFDIDHYSKEEALCYLLDAYQIGQAIIFCNSKQGTGKLTSFLESKCLSALAIHGDKSQADRKQALDSFRKGGVSLLIATDVAARGLDIAYLPTVINFDLPFNSEDYIHRIGRTGRAGLAGKAFSLVKDSDAIKVRDIAALLQKKISMVKLILPSMQENSVVGHSCISKKPRLAAKERKLDPIFFEPYQPHHFGHQSDVLSEKSKLEDCKKSSSGQKKSFLKENLALMKKDSRPAQVAFLLEGCKKSK